jgi:snapalysin
MTPRNAARTLVALLASALFAIGGQAAAAGAPPAAGGERALAAVVLTYDASGAAEFTEAVHGGAAVWNETVAAVRLEPVRAGSRANIRVVADDGWPRARTISLGNGTVWMGRQAVDEGYDTLRIAAHELGHLLGLPDIKPGPCSSLMSGSTAGTGCANPYPDARERAAVEANFANAAAAAPAPVAVPSAS